MSHSITPGGCAVVPPKAGLLLDYLPSLSAPAFTFLKAMLRSQEMAQIPEDERIYIQDAASLLNRRMDTLRRWDRLYLPKHLKAHRDKSGRRWRYWTAKQMKEIFDWIENTDRRPGKGLPHWNPSQEEIDSALEKMRKPRVESVRVDS